ncbi:MAG: hypothetical protein J7513_06405 [Solirubrobacteraceae bacterium]|nr:hypothetical protein [Solirubrobacteraceae bacterium]
MRLPEVFVGVGTIAVCVVLLLLAFQEQPTRIRYDVPAPSTAVAATVLAGERQARATENTGIRTRQIAAVAAVGAGLSLFLAFLNLRREHERDAVERDDRNQQREFENERLNDQRLETAITHLAHGDEIVRIAGIAALEELAKAKHGRTELVSSVLTAWSERPSPGLETASERETRAANDAISRVHLLRVWDALWPYVELARYARGRKWGGMIRRHLSADPSSDLSDADRAHVTRVVPDDISSVPQLEAVLEWEERNQGGLAEVRLARNAVAHPRGSASPAVDQIETLSKLGEELLGELQRLQEPSGS